MERPPHPALRATFSREGRGSGKDALTQPSPLAGEGGASAPGEGTARRPRTGETGRTLRLAKRLRRTMTDVEMKLWQQLRAHRFENYKFKRQVPIGKYIVDFVCLEHRLIVEVDGGQHSESVTDIVRDAWLASQWFRTLRFWNVDVLQALDGTLLAILDALQQPRIPGYAGPSPARGEGRKANHDP